MKRILFVLFMLGILFVGCSKSPEQKAKDLVSEFIKKNANDPDSYEPVEWGSLDSVQNLVYADPKFQQLNKDIQNENSDTRMLSIDLAKSMLANKGYGFGWSIEHKFRAKNGFGAKMLGNSTFYLDSALTKVVGQEK